MITVAKIIVALSGFSVGILGVPAVAADTPAVNEPILTVSSSVGIN